MELNKSEREGGISVALAAVVEVEDGTEESGIKSRDNNGMEIESESESRVEDWSVSEETIWFVKQVVERCPFAWVSGVASPCFSASSSANKNPRRRQYA